MEIREGKTLFCVKLNFPQDSRASSLSFERLRQKVCTVHLRVYLDYRLHCLDHIIDMRK